MSERIKEILDELKNEDNYIEDYGFRYKRIALDDIWYLLDYITNLQEENKEIKNTIDFIDNKYKNTINYNEKLIEYNQDYKSRCEKAIEYINKNKHLSMFADCREPEEDWNYDLEINPRDLLNILQGVDNK